MAEIPIKMRVNHDKNTTCSLCGTKWKNTREMWDLKISKNIYTLCYDCTDVLFHKTLSAQCQHNAKVKSKEDMQRILNYNDSKGLRNA